MTTLSGAFDCVLALLVIAVAVAAIVARTAFSAVVAFVSFGMLLALVWVRLAAIDVALTEAAIGSGVTGALLIGAAGRLRKAEAQAAAGWPSALQCVLAAIFCATIAAALAFGVLSLPDPPPTLAAEAVANLAATGLGNPVNAVLIAYRAYDTLLEKFVLLLALIGVWSLAADRHWGGIPGSVRRGQEGGIPGSARRGQEGGIPGSARRGQEGGSARRGQEGGALSLLGQLLPPIGALVGIHLLWAGATDPGGAFQGGTILAAMWILAITAGLVEAPPINHPWLRIALVVGPTVFLLVGLSGLPLAGAFLAYPEGFEKPMILFIEAPLVLSIAAMLAMLALGPPRRGPSS